MGSKSLQRLENDQIEALRFKVKILSVDLNNVTGLEKDSFEYAMCQFWLK